MTQAFAELPPIIEEVLLDGGRQQRLLPINFDEYVDINNEDTTILLELEDSKEQATAAESNNDVEYEYYYVYEDIENDTYDEAINEKSNITEREADHFISHLPAGLPHLSQNGFVPIIPNPHHVVPAVPVVHHPPVVHAPVPAPPLDGYGVPVRKKLL